MEDRKPHYNIYKELKRNYLTTWITLGMSGAIVICTLICSYLFYVYQINHVLAMRTNGEVVPMEWMERRDVIEIECKSHLNRWVGTYYTFDHDNIKKQRELGLWLIDSDDGENLEKFYINNHWFDNVKKFMIKQTGAIIDSSIRIDVRQEPYKFQAETIITVKQNDKIDIYKMKIKGDLIHVSRNYPFNSHGLLIDHYQESAKELMESKEQIYVE